MPKFYFDITTDGQTAIDTCGLDLSSRATAHEEAVRSVAEISSENVSTLKPHVVQVAVRDAEHHHICVCEVKFNPGKID